MNLQFTENKSKIFKDEKFKSKTKRKTEQTKQNKQVIFGKKGCEKQQRFPEKRTRKKIQNHNFFFWCLNFSIKNKTKKKIIVIFVEKPENFN